jgi:hypothetical protein
MKHECHAYGCTTSVPPKMLMCLKHWKMVPKFAQDDVWATYLPGQEVRKDPSSDYIKAQQRARILCYMKEKNMNMTSESDLLSAAITVIGNECSQ